MLNPFPQIGHLFGPSVLSDPCFTPSPVEALLTVGGEVIVFGVCKPFPRELSMLVLSLVATSAEDWGDALIYKKHMKIIQNLHQIKIHKNRDWS